MPNINDIEHLSTAVQIAVTIEKTVLRLAEIV